jgi:hypothetical protein
MTFNDFMSLIFVAILSTFVIFQIVRGILGVFWYTKRDENE